MADVHDPVTRSRNMAAIRSTNTKPELLIRRALHARGFRYRLHDRRLPGKPDLVFPRIRAVLFVNGCFWHGHDCPAFRWPAAREAFWRDKIGGNVVRDLKNAAALTDAGWRVAVIWECALHGPRRLPPAEVIDRITGFLKASDVQFCIEGHPVATLPDPSSGDDADSGRRAFLRQTARGQ